jgi:hypothetical protein
MSGGTFDTDNTSISDIGDFDVGISPIEGGLLSSSVYSSRIGLFVINRSPVGLHFIPVPDRRRVVFLLPEYPDQFATPDLEDTFKLPAPEGWSY